MTSRKSIGERTEPRRTPRLTAKAGEVVLPTQTDECTSLYQSFMSRQAFPDIPEFFRWLRRTGYSIETGID